MPTGSTFPFRELCSGALRGAVRAAVSEGVSAVTRGAWQQETQALESDLLPTLFSDCLNSFTLTCVPLYGITLQSNKLCPYYVWLLIHSKVTLTQCVFLFLTVSLFSLSALVRCVERAASLPELTPAQRNKLRHLSIISLASNLKVLVH